MNLEFEKGYTKIYDCNTFNINDEKGIIFLHKMLVLYILLISILWLLLQPDKNKYKFLIIVLSVIFASVLVTTIIYYSIELNTIEILYAFSYLISRQVRTPEFLNLDKYFPNYKKIESKYADFKQDVLNYFSNYSIKTVDLTYNSLNGVNKLIGNDIKIDKNGVESGWRLITLKIGSKVTGKCQKYFPAIAKVIGEMPEVISCVLSILEPGIMIPIHIGYYKGIIRYMLPLVIPKDKDNCLLWVNGITYSWTEGVSVLWDDIYPHKVINNTTENRILLYMDIIRPLPRLMGDLNQKVLRLIDNSQIVKDEIKRTEYKLEINN